MRLLLFLLGYALLLTCEIFASVNSNHEEKEIPIHGMISELYIPISPDSTGKVTIKTFMNSQSIDEWLGYAAGNSSILAKGDKNQIEKKVRELCVNKEIFIRLMNSNPTYINKASLEDIGIEYVTSLNDIPWFLSLFPNSQKIDRFIASKEQTLTRSDMIMILEYAPTSQKAAAFKRILIDNSKTLDECIEVASACIDCREELAGKCVQQLENSTDYRRFINMFRSTKYAPSIITKYNEITSKTAENLGSNINTEYPDFGPVISPDGTTMYFTRKNNPESYGGEDIYVSKLNKYGEWSPAENIKPPLNNYEHNGVYSVSQDGKQLFLHNNYDEGGHNPSITTWEQQGWGDPVTQQIPNLKPKSNYHNGSLSIDGKYLLMSIKRNDSYGSRFLFWKSGGNDIYVILKDSMGNWLEPRNLGPIINTDEEEGSVYIAADGETIYFSSSGHGGYGSQDMFMSRRLDSTWTNWTKPLNLGSTINSFGDDDFYVIPAKGDFIYFSSDRDGFGAEDIFRIGLPIEMRPKPVAVIKGSVRNKKDNSPIAAKVIYEDLETGVELGSVETNPLTGEYQIILVGGKRYAIIPAPITPVKTEALLTTKSLTFPNQEDSRNSNTVDAGITNGANKKESENGNTDGALKDQKNADLQNSTSSSNVNSTTNTNSTSITNTTNITNNTSKITISSKQSNTINQTSITQNVVIAESQYIDLVDLKEYIEMEQSLVVVPVETGQSISLNNLFFQVGSFVLKKESFLELNRIVKVMQENPDIKIEIGGHTDDIGSDESNRILSEKRAFEVYSFLIKLSVSKERLTYVGYGESKPKVQNNSDANRAANRRVELKIR